MKLGMSKTAEEMMEDWEAKERAWKKRMREHEDNQISEFVVADQAGRNDLTQEIFNNLPREAQLFIISITGQISHFSHVLEEIHDLSR